MESGIQPLLSRMQVVGIQSEKLKNCDRPARLPLYANVYSDLSL